MSISPWLSLDRNTLFFPRAMYTDMWVPFVSSFVYSQFPPVFIFLFLLGSTFIQLTRYPHSSMPLKMNMRSNPALPPQHAKERMPRRHRQSRNKLRGGGRGHSSWWPRGKILTKDKNGYGRPCSQYLLQLAIRNILEYWRIERGQQAIPVGRVSVLQWQTRPLRILI